MDTIREKWTNNISTVTLGALKDEGGTRTSKITVGGMKSLPFLSFEGEIPNKPVIAMEIYDKIPENMPLALKDAFSDVQSDTGKWARKCVQEYKAEMISIRLLSTHPDEGDNGPESAVKTVKNVIESVGVPIIIIGSGVIDKDNIIIPTVSKAARGERCLLGTALQDNYKTIVQCALSDGHAVIGESPIDINIAKQVNIMMNDSGLPLDRIIMYPTTGALGYGIEYAYSIMERSRIAALSGDSILGVPMLCYVGEESWKTKEAKSENEIWGELKNRGILWEAATAAAFLQAGADILIMHHPDSVETIRKTISRLTENK